MSTYIPPPPGPPWARGNKAKNIMPTIRRLLRYAKPFHASIALVIVLGIMVMLLSMYGPQLLSSMTDYVADCIEERSAVDTDAVLKTALILVAIYGCTIVLEWSRIRIEWTSEERLGNMLRKDLSKKISRISVGRLDSMRMGDIMSRFVNDSDTIRLHSVESITHSLQSIMMMVGSMVMMFVTEWRLAIVVLIPTFIGFLIVRVIVKFSQKYYRAQSRNLGKMNTIVEETYRGLDVINSYNGLDEIKGRFAEVNEDLYVVSFRSRLLGGFLPELSGFVNNLGYVLVCVMGSLLIFDGTSTFGTLVAFIVYVKMCNRPLMELSGSLGGLQETAAAAERIFEFMDTPEMDPETEFESLPAEIKGRIEFKDVNFSYVPDVEIIHNLNLTVEPGQRIAIVGPTGAGKTTISNLLLRYYDPDSGTISLDGTDTTKFRREDVRKLFSVVLQETWLFKGTVRQNLVFGSDDVPDSRLEEVCEAVGLGRYLRSLPNGLDTYIDRPQSLSSGQRQQITIARAIIKDAPLLIMDEATSSVDTRTEHAIQDAMDKLMRGRTSFIIAHRLSTIKSADHIIVIKKGEIIERGTHEELIAKGGFYRSLYDSQFEFCE